MTRTLVFGIGIAAVLAVIVTIALGWRPQRASPPTPIIAASAAPVQPLAAPAEPIPLPPVVGKPVVVLPTPPTPPTPPAPTENTGEPAAPSERPDLMREERNQAKAVDLFAEKTLQLEDRFSDDPDAEEAPETHTLHQFRDREDDDNAPDSERTIGDHLREWMRTFPPEVADRLVLVSVECRVGACRILIAELAIDMEHQATAMGVTALTALFVQPWWQQDFIGQDVTTETHPDQPGATIGHAMLTIYATRTPTPG